MIHYGFDMRGGDAVPRRPLFREIRQTSAVSAHIVPKLFGDLFGALNRKGLDIARSPVAPGQLGGLLDLVADGTISGRIAKDVFAEMVESGADAAAIVEQKGLRQLSDTGMIEAAVDAALAAHPAQVAQYATNPKVLGFFVGQVMKATGGKANPGVVNELLAKKLAG